MPKKFCYIWFALFLSPITLFAFDPVFEAATNYEVGVLPISVTTADFDGDGDPDLAVTNDGISKSISILKNNGDGTFAPRVDYGTGTSPFAIFASDLDNDGDVDLVVTRPSSDSISVLKNNGDGTFAAKVDYQVGDRPAAIFAADLDGDGDIDLAITNIGSVTVSILKNNGDGTFAPKVDYGTGSGPTSVFAADFDRDGDLDLAIPSVSSAEVVSILKNNGDGTFAPKVDYPAGPTPSSIFATDLDGDGDADLAVTNTTAEFPGAFAISILKNKGDGTFAPRVSYGTSGVANFIIAADMDRDGDQDLVVSNSRAKPQGVPEGTVVSIFKNDGDGTFSNRLDFGSGGLKPSNLVASDLDGDGDMDLAVPNTDLSTGNSGNLIFAISVLKNKGDGTLAAPTYFETASDPLSVSLSDLNGDGNKDIITAGDGIVEGTGGVSVLINKGDGTFAPKVFYAMGPGFSYSVFAADLDGDADNDLAVVNGGGVSVLKNNGDGTFAAKADYATGSSPRSVYAADLDGDGDIDLAVANAGSNNVSILKNNGDGTFANKIDYGTGAGPIAVFAADLDGDSDFDLATANGGGMSVLKNNGDGTFLPKIDYAFGSFNSIFCCDLDGDGDTDIVLVANLSFVVLKNNGSGTFTISGVYAEAIGLFQSVFAADFDRDGDFDLVITESFIDAYPEIRLFRNYGNGTFTSSEDYASGVLPIAVYAADLEGDGDIDLAVAKYFSSTVTIFKNIAPCGLGVKGDMNCDANLTAADVMLLINCAFLGEGPCSLGLADVNCDGVLTAADVVLELNKVFLGTPFPCP